nr:MAG TPA: hypothetical protein [Caudoviricetes sp.]
MTNKIGCLSTYFYLPLNMCFNVYYILRVIGEK